MRACWPWSMPEIEWLSNAEWQPRLWLSLPATPDLLPRGRWSWQWCGRRIAQSIKQEREVPLPELLASFWIADVDSCQLLENERQIADLDFWTQDARLFCAVQELRVEL